MVVEPSRLQWWPLVSNGFDPNSLSSQCYQQLHTALQAFAPALGRMSALHALRVDRMPAFHALRMMLAETARGFGEEGDLYLLELWVHLKGVREVLKLCDATVACLLGQRKGLRRPSPACAAESL